MSSFLGPIHHWLYNKIQIQNQLTVCVAQLAVENNWITEQENIYTIDTQPLEEIIDESNIHGWLQDRIHIAEQQFAVLITKLLDCHADRMNKILEVATAFGKKYALNSLATPQVAYKVFEDTFVNGMPCDGVNHVTYQDEDCVFWEEVIDVHSDYWTKIDGNPKHYYLIREAVFNGMLSNINLKFEEVKENNYRIFKY